MKLLSFCQRFTSRRSIKITKQLFSYFIGVLLVALCKEAEPEIKSDNLTLSMENAPIEKLFYEINEQTGYGFVYRWELFENRVCINLHVEAATIVAVLDSCLKNQGIEYEIISGTVVLMGR